MTDFEVRFLNNPEVLPKSGTVLPVNAEKSFVGHQSLSLGLQECSRLTFCTLNLLSGLCNETV